MQYNRVVPMPGKNSIVMPGEVTTVRAYESDAPWVFGNEYYVVQCEVHGTKFATDARSQRIYAKLAQECRIVGQNTPRVHQVWHAQEGHSCWVDGDCCEIFPVEPLSMVHTACGEAFYTSATEDSEDFTERLFSHVHENCPADTDGDTKYTFHLATPDGDSLPD